MGVTLTAGQKVFVDTAPLIYLVEDEGSRADKVAGFLDLSTRLGVLWVTSLVTYMEILVLPTRKGQRELAGKYRDFLTNSEQISLHPLDVCVADAAVELRARHGIKVPDAIQLATARVSGADIVLTNDRSWAAIPGPRVLCVDDL